MKICRTDPTTDPRWQTFIESHPEASIFHTPGWLEALRRTYGYEPIVYVGIGRGQQFVSGIPFCKVESFLTGRRLVSLPFSDHCQPLVGSEEELIGLLATACDDAKQDRLKYVEIRPLISDESRIQETTHLAKSNSVLVHKVDLLRSEADLLKSFHKDYRRKFARGEHERLLYEEGRSEELLAKFYRLLLLTRRRHLLPPQPLAWFRNLIDCLGEKLKIQVVSKDDTPIASIVTLSFKNVVVDKYSCSDAKFNSLRGTLSLLWRTIRESRREGLRELDLGRSDYSNSGLITFKEHWGAAPYRVNYYRCPAPIRDISGDSRLAAIGKRLLTSMPDSMLSALGGLLYRHAG